MDTDATSASTSDVKNEPKDHLAQAMDELTGGGGKNDDDADIDELNKLGMFFSQTVLMMKMSTRHLPLTNHRGEIVAPMSTTSFVKIGSKTKNFYS